MFNSTKPCSKPVFVLLLPLLLAALAAAGLGTASAHDSSAGQHPTQFTDVHSDSFYVTAVDWMVQNEITTGTSPTTFHPDRNVTRGEAAAFLWRMSCRPEPSTSHSFSDVHADWQQQPVGWLLQHGAAPIQGTGTEPADMYGPSTLLTRAQIAALLYQLFSDDTLLEETVSPFVDVTEPWQIAPVLWLLVNEITTGTSDTTFHPDRNVSRGEFATFLWRHNQKPEPAQRICEPPPCGAGLVKLDEFVTETDNGCRTADCVYGRNATGNCRWYSEWAAELVRDCPTVDTSDGLGAMDQNVSDNSVPPIEFPQLEAGTNWTAEIWLVDNRHFPPDGIKPDNNNDTFLVALRTPPEGGFTYVPSVPGGPGGSLLLSNDATDGEWSVPFAVHENTPLHNPFELSVTASGSGCWAVRFTPS